MKKEFLQKLKNFLIINMGGLFSIYESDEYYEPKYEERYYTKVLPGKNIYKIDDNYVYWRGDSVDGVNGKEFIDLGHGYGKDDHYIFYTGMKISKIKDKYFKVLHKGYSKDSVNVYYKGKQIHNVDPKTFKVTINGTATDKKHYYKYGKIIGNKRKRRRSK